jgi:lysophospholipase L1-like esterase
MKFILNISIVLASSLASLLIAEVIIRLTIPQTLTSSLYERDSAGIVVHRRDFTGRMKRPDVEALYYFDKDGARVAQHGEREPSGSGDLNIMVLGDSFTFGHGVNYEDSIVGVLEARLKAAFSPKVVRLRNFGVGGWGTADYIRFLEEHGDELKPDALLILFNGDDIGRSLRSSLYIYDKQSQLLEPTVPPASLSRTKHLIRKFTGYDLLAEHSHLLTLVRQSISRRIGSFQPREVPSKESASPLPTAFSEQLFSRLIQWCKTRHTPLLIGTTCFLEKMHAVEKLFPETAAFVAEAPSYFAKEGVRYFDCSGAFHAKYGENYEDLVIPRDGHPNEAGSRAISDLLYPEVAAWLRALIGRREQQD